MVISRGNVIRYCLVRAIDVWSNGGMVISRGKPTQFGEKSCSSDALSAKICNIN
jgi:hypothetical protein